MTRLHLLRMFIICFYYQVDIIGGDANGAAYRYMNGQPRKNYKIGNVTMAFKRVASHYNDWLNEWKVSIRDDYDLRRWIETQYVGGQFIIN